jgi:hypothetical protein
MTDYLSQRLHILLAIDKEQREEKPCLGFIEACQVALRVLDYDLKNRVALHIELSQPDENEQDG